MFTLVSPVLLFNRPPPPPPPILSRVFHIKEYNLSRYIPFKTVLYGMLATLHLAGGKQ